MKYKTLVKKLKLSEQDLEKIKSTVQNVESQTDGEIAVAIAPESAHYSFLELLAANILAGILLSIMLPFSSKLHDFYTFLYWNNAPDWIIPACYIVTCFVIITIGFFLANIPAIDRLIVPKQIKKTKATHLAFKYFVESGIYKTKNHCGILIFVSYLERQVRIVADEGISCKISQDLWNLIADELAEEIKNGNTSSAIINAVEKCGELLAENYPRTSDKTNELKDDLVILEDSECE